jgi:hypothetical protein
MEPHVAKRLVVDSAIFQSENAEVGMLIGDDDSSTTVACQAASIHPPIIEQSNVDHATGGVKKQLYSTEKSHQELTKYCMVFLHGCFMYAVAQNKGNSKAMADAICCILYHTFNDHSKCGTWCGYLKDKVNYDHKIVPGGFKEQQLFEELRYFLENSFRCREIFMWCFY